MRPVGSKENFYIHDEYVARPDNKHFDDTPFKDEWQREVYDYASIVCEMHGLRSVVDVGCGSGYKLVNMLGTLETVGIEMEPAYSFLVKTYPDRQWLKAAPGVYPYPKENPDLVICADVIEHVDNPAWLLWYIQEMQPKFVVLSTPDVSKLGLGTEDGPPKNLHHVREWNAPQFHALVSDFFTIYEHCYDGTQIVFAGPRK
jgi:2-polyprenyl-3-methyl-5-hydroxy-6-metoxy-1,4-benzoquinol methylase